MNSNATAHVIAHHKGRSAYAFTAKTALDFDDADDYCEEGGIKARWDTSSLTPPELAAWERYVVLSNIPAWWTGRLLAA